GQDLEAGDPGVTPGRTVGVFLDDEGRQGDDAFRRRGGAERGGHRDEENCSQPDHDTGAPSPACRGGSKNSAGAHASCGTTKGARYSRVSSALAASAWWPVKRSAAGSTA